VIRIALVAVVLTLTACPGTSQFIRITPSFQETAEANYERGLAASKTGNYLLAQQYFEYIRSHFGYSKWSQNAELAIADIEGGRGHWPEAIDLYDKFQRAFPAHEQVTDGYVAFKICEAIAKTIPTKWLLSAPTAEQEQSSSNEANRALADFFARYPSSPWIPEAKKLFDETVRHLVDHELYVASYYLKHDKPRAAAWRIEGVLATYPGCAREAEALYSLGEVYLRLKEPTRARDTFRRLITQYPLDVRAAKAKLQLDQLAETHPG
jgi:outer membrane protein assembly factor BamD